MSSDVDVDVDVDADVLGGGKGRGKQMTMAVSSGTHPGALQETCMAITEVPASSASEGMHSSTYCTTRRLCWRKARFSLAENIVGLWMCVYYNV